MGAGAIAAMNVIFALLDRAQQIQELIQTARKEGRDVTAAELDALKAADDVARAKLDEAIKAAKG